MPQETKNLHPIRSVKKWQSASMKTTVISLMAILSSCARQPPPPASTVFKSNGHPILADGSYYSADPAPIVDSGSLYIISGADQAPDGVNDFIMNNWQMFQTQDVEAGVWRHYPNVGKPEEIFHWAAPGRAYAAQIAKGPDGLFYMYAPVAMAKPPGEDPFAIGVAVSKSPLGPWRDAHPQGPIISQAVPVKNNIQNIDPTILVDIDHRIYIYWGTFGKLRMMELSSDMLTPKGPEREITTLSGFFEAPWILRRKDTYYMMYAANTVGHGPQDCTPTLYHACIAYGTAPSPFGPWTYRGVVMGPVSSTTSHEGVVEFKGRWYFIYHTADAVGGGHFRRSVAIDPLFWNDDVVPAAPVRIMNRPTIPPRQGADGNVAPLAVATASEPVSAQYWINALNDQIIRNTPLPPDMWSSWHGTNNPEQVTLTYNWKEPVKINSVSVKWWADHPPHAEEGVAPPKRWHLEYWTGEKWQTIKARPSYFIETDHPLTISFTPISTSRLRLIADASGEAKHAGMAIEEWKVFSATPPSNDESFEGSSTTKIHNPT